MADDDKKLMNVDTQIFHELGKLGGDQQALIRDMTGIRSDMKERTDVIVKAIDSHLAEDTRRFEKADTTIEKTGERIKVLENWRWYVLGIMATLAFAGWFWGVLK